MKTPRWALVGSIYCFIAVALGAFGAHALATVLDEKMQAIWHTATLYLFVHALGLILWDIFSDLRKPQGFARWCGWAFAIGAALFSGSLYLLATSGIRALGAITPFGGVLFLAGWLCFARAALSAKSSN